MILQRLKKQPIFDLILAVFLVALSVFINQLLVSKKIEIQQWDNLFYDFESSLKTTAVDDHIVILAIDDISLSKLGKWPWSRALHAGIIDRLTEAKVEAVALDILFMEPDLMFPENDRLLATAIRKNGRVVLPVLTTVQNEGVIVTKPLSEIAEAAAQLVHVNMHFDKQGVVRDLDLSVKVINNSTIPAMALALHHLTVEQTSSLNYSEGGRMLINYQGPPGHFKQISYVDVLLDKNVLKQLQGKIVLIGMTASGVGNRIATPVSKKLHLMSGIELHANALSTLQSGRITHALNWSIYTVITIFLITIPVFLFRLLTPAYALVLVVIFSILTVVVSTIVLNQVFLWFSPLPTLLCLFVSYPLWSKKKVEQLNHSLFTVNAKATSTLEAIGDAVITTDDSDCIEFMNPAAENMFATSLVKVKKKPFSELFTRLDFKGFEELSLGVLTKLGKKTEIQAICNVKGEEIAVRVSSSPMYDEKKRPLGMVYAFNDLTEIINIHRKISFVATHDALTKLPNRILFQDRIQQSIVKANRESLQFAVLFIDLDGFKKINDAMGHHYGDELLQLVADSLSQWVRKSDTIARWGGDEFVVLLENLASLSDAADIARKIVDGLANSMLINQQEVFVTSSIGISLFPEDGEEANTLIVKADAAMYSVKKQGKNGFCFYSQKLKNQAKEKLILEVEIRKAIEHDEFEMYYQPQIDLMTKKLIGTEALIRWNHPIRGFISPDEFIPLAEEVGLIVDLGGWVITTVCLQLKSWQLKELDNFKVAINLSTQQFVDKDLVRFITSEINKYGLSSKVIQLEITESMMIQDIDQVINILDNLKTAGISIAIDDFGTGYSSLEYLKRLPIDKLKIDKSFIDSIHNNKDDANIVQAVIALGHNLGMEIIAEGVENNEQADFLQEKSCDYAQGYLYSKALPAQQMGLLIEKLK